jgi:hypothetical protein
MYVYWTDAVAGAPGLRAHRAEHYYSAYVLDPGAGDIDAVGGRE